MGRISSLDIGKKVFFKFCFALFGLVLSAGCISNYKSSGPYYQDGRLKPVVAVLPVADRTNHLFGWDSSPYLTHVFQNTVESDTQFHISPRENLKNIISKVDQKDLFTSPEIVAKQFHPGNDYLIAMELLDQSIENYRDHPEHKQTLDTSKGAIHLTGRVLVVSFYQGGSRVILQEMITIKQPIHYLDEELDYNKITPEDSRFSNSALQQAYKRLAKEATHRMQRYIGLERGNA